MDSVKSFRRYGKVDDEHEERAFRKKTRWRLIILCIALVLIVLVIGVTAGTVVHNKNKSRNILSASITSSDAAIKSICNVTQYPVSCYNTLISSNTSNPLKIFQFSLTYVLDSFNELSTFPEVYINQTNDPAVKQALSVCRTGLSEAIDSLNDCISSAKEHRWISGSQIGDLRTWLTAATTDLETCFDTLVEVNADFVAEIRDLMRNSTESVTNSLAIVTRVLPNFENVKFPVNRKLLAEEESDFPAWVGAGERQLLQTVHPTPDLTVAQDGSGNYTTINDALGMIPIKSESRFVMYVKEGKYVENVNMGDSYWNVMIYGDGKDKTIVSGSRSNFSKFATIDTATFTITGRGFIAQDMGFENTAKAEGNQAVALRSGSDQSTFYRCSFDAFQDTLYVHKNRQFYRECDIKGTVDFIFGNAAVVFQDCNILPRQPGPGQSVTITAQSRSGPNQNTGISIQKCDISPLDDLTARTYLGRPWKDYARVVVMQTTIGSFLNEEGWSVWDPIVGTPPAGTIFYAEYMNNGPGSNTAGRVTWAGYKPTLTQAEALQYTVKSFILNGGTSWLPEDVAYDLTLGS